MILALLLILLTSSFSLHAQNIVYTSYELEKEMSLDDLYTEAFKQLSPEYCYKKLIELNIDLNPQDKEKAGTLVYLPSKNQCPYKMPSTLEKITQSLIIEPEQRRYYSNIHGSLAYFYSSIKGENLDNDTSLFINSINNFRLQLASNFYFEKWQLQTSISSHFIEFENSLETEVKDAKLNYSYIGFDSIYKMSNSWSMVITQRFGEGILHKDDSSDLRLFKYFKWTGQIGLRWSKDYAKSLRSSMTISAGHSIAVSNGDDNPQGGLNYAAGIKIETIKENQKNYFVEISSNVENESSGNYNQQLITSGISAGINYDF